MSRTTTYAIESIHAGIVGPRVYCCGSVHGKGHEREILRPDRLHQPHRQRSRDGTVRPSQQLPHPGRQCGLP